MMMDRRHAKDSLAAQFKRADLKDDAERFVDENATDEKQQNFLLHNDGDNADRAAEGERTDIAHEHFGGMRVVPKKAERSADERAAKNGKFADARDVLNFQIVRPAVVAADVSEHGQRACSDDSAADGEAVETVGEIDGVGRARDDDRDKDQKRKECERPKMFGVDEGMDDEVRMHALQERENELRGVSAVRGQHQKRGANDEADKDLQREFALGGEAEVLPFGNFGVVVNESDRGETKKSEERDQYKRVLELGPKENANSGRENDEHAAHGGRACDLVVLLRAFFATV